MHSNKWYQSRRLEKSGISPGAWHGGIEIEGSVEQKLRRAMDGYQNACKDLDSLIYLIVHGCLWGLLHACQLSFFLLNQISQGFSFVRCGYLSSGRSTRFLWRVDEDVHLGTKIEKKNYVTRKVKAGRRSLTLCGHVSCFASSSIKQKGVYGSRLHQGNRVVREPRACDG